MSAKALSVTAEGFEKLFVSLALRHPLGPKQGTGTSAKAGTCWREIAWEALRSKKLGNSLRNAIGALSAKYREVLFLRDVKYLDASEAAWVLEIPVEAVRSRLRIARTRVRCALASALSPKHPEKNSRRPHARRIPCSFLLPIGQNSSSLA